MGKNILAHAGWVVNTISACTEMQEQEFINFKITI